MKRISFAVLVAVLCIAIFTAPAFAQGTTPGYADLNTLLAAVTGLATATIIGGVKTLEAKIDVAFISKLGNVLPVLVLALNFALPKLWVAVHLPGAVPDATVLVNTPVATAVSIVARELFQLIFHKPLPSGTAVA